MIREVYFVLLEYGRAHELRSLELLLPTVHRVFPHAQVRGVVVDNAEDQRGEVRVADDLYRMGGDNTLREFSGWDRGISWIEGRYGPSPTSVFVLANDTIVRPDKHDRVRDIPADRAEAAANGAVVGWIDEYPEPVALFGMTLRQWIDSSLILLSHSTLSMLRPLARHLDDAELFSDSGGIFREPSPLSENYRAYLAAYFFGELTSARFDHRWYAHEPLTDRNIEAFKTKLRCVFCEHLVSARARAYGIPLVDIRPTSIAIDPVDVGVS